ncbi:MAG: hypothetical protein HYX51_07140 [Chloroflexi bacterium]|nr:hypothetical protein [Chloroflexota bacterium]
MSDGWWLLLFTAVVALDLGVVLRTVTRPDAPASWGQASDWLRTWFVLGLGGMAALDNAAITWLRGLPMDWWLAATYGIATVLIAGVAVFVIAPTRTGEPSRR